MSTRNFFKEAQKKYGIEKTDRSTDLIQARVAKESGEKEKDFSSPVTSKFKAAQERLGIGGDVKATFRSRYQDLSERYNKAADSYHRAYQKDTGSYVPKSLASDRYTIIQGHKLDAMNKEIKTLLSDIDGMAGELDSDWVNEAKKNLTQMDGSSNAMWNSAKESKDYWNSFANEEEYNTFIKDQEHKRYLLKDFNPEEAQKEVESLQKEISDYHARNSWTKIMPKEASLWSDQEVRDFIDRETQIPYEETQTSYDIDGYLAIREKEKNLSSLSKDIKDRNFLVTYNDYLKLMENPDFEKNKTGKYKAEFDWSKFDYTINSAVNGGKARLEITDSIPPFSAGVSTRYDAPIGRDFIAREMTDNERDIYNYLYNTQGEEKANEFFSFLEKSLKDKADYESVRKWSELADDHPIFSSIISVPQNLFSGAEQIVRYADYFATGETSKNYTSLASSTIRGTVTEKIDNDVLGYIYNIGMSCADSIAAAYVPGNLGGIALGGSAASQSWNEGIDRGLSDEQLVLGSLAAGVCECVFENISIGNLKALKEINPSSVKDIAMNMLKSTVVNASEETATEIGNIICDTIISGNMSEWYTSIQKYIDEDGMSFEDAKSKVFGEKVLQVLEAGASGALQGGIMSGAVSGRNAYSGRKTGKYANENIVSAVKELGLTTDPNSKAYHMAQGLSAESKNLYKGATIAEVLNEVYGNQTVSVVEQMLKDGGYEGKNLTETAREFLSSAENSDMSRKVVRAIGENVELMKVWQKLTNSALIDTDAIAASLKEAGIQEKHADVLARTMALSAQNKTSDSYLESFLENEKVAEIYKEVQNEIEQGKTAERFIPNEENRLGAKRIEEQLRELAEKRVENEHKQQINENQNQTGIPDMPSLTAQQISDIKNVKITDNGQIMVETDSGEANLFDLPLPDDSIDVIANSVKYGDSAKTFFTSFIHGQDPTKYDQNFFRIYLMAGEGFSLEQIGKAYPEVFDGMFPPQIEMAFRSGYYDRRSHTQQTHEAIKKKAAKAKESGAKARSGAVDTSVVDAWVKKTGNRLTKKQKAEIEAGRVIASEIGIDVKYVVNFQDANGKKVGMIDPVTGKISGANGEISFREETGKIEMILDINAGLSNFTTKEGQASILRAMSHELTHFIEKMSPRMYQDLQEFMIQNIDFGEDSFHGLVAQKMESLKIGETQAVREVIANACETMLGDSDVMEKLYRQNAKLGDRILNWLSEKIEAIDRAIEKIRAIFKTASEGDTAQFAESKALTANLDVYKQALQKWETALLDAAQNYQNGGLVQSGDSAQYSIRYTTDNKPVVVVQEDILDGVPKSQWVKTVKDTISEKYSGGIPVSGRLIKVNKITKTEFTNSEYTKSLKKKNTSIYFDKFKTANNLDEIILASTNYINEDLKHERKDKFVEFARGKVLMRIGGNDYSAQVIIAFTSGNNMVLYDIIKFKKEVLKIKKDGRQTVQTQKVQNSRDVPSLIDDSISQNDSSVNNQYMQNNKINSEQSVKYSEREYSYEELTAKPDMKVTEIDDSVTYTANSETRKQIVSQAIKNAASVGYTNENGNAVVHVKDIDTDVIVSKKAIQHSLDRRLSINAPVVEKVGEILSSSIKINELNPRTDNIEKSYVLIGMAKNTNKEPYVVSFVVNGYTNEISSFDVLYSVNAKTEPAGSLSPKVSTPSTDSTISISQLLETVNRYFPDILPESVLRRFGHEARPDGTLGQSALYSEREGNYDRKIIDQAIKDREDIAKALDEIAQTAEEQKILTDYAEGLEQMKEEYINLEKIKRSLNELYDEKKKLSENGEKMPDFYKKKIEIYREMGLIGRKISAYDKRLLRLEKMDIFRDIVSREKSYARLKQRKKVFEKEYREKKIRRIQATVKRINRLLTKPDGTKNVKDGLQKESMKFMQTFLNNTSVFNKKQLERLSEFYKKIEDGEEVNTGNTGVYNEDIQNTIDQLKQTIAGKRLSQLSKEELEKTGELVDHFSHIIKTENEVFIEGKRKKLDETAFRIIDKLNEMNDRKENQFLSRKTVSELRNLLSSKMTTPVYFFEKIPGFEALYHDLLKAQDQKALLLIQARESFDQAKEKYHYYAWSEAKNAEKDFLNLTTAEGKTLTISREEALFLYATDKREQSNTYQKAKHLSEGGILMESGLRTIKQGKLGRTEESYQKETEPTRISDSDMKKIKQWLTDEQKAYADAMVEYMSKSLSVIGNQTAMELFGIRIFDEPYYFPRSSAKNYLQKKNDRISAEGFNRLKYLSLARHLVQDANNPITVGNFTDTVVNHTNAMLTYGTFCTPIENLVRIWGYKFKLSNGDYISVRQLIEAKFGKEANQYIQDFIDDIAGEAAPDNAGLLDMTVSTFKKTAVAANLSVIVQQPSAFVRAMMIIEPLYFIKALSVKGNYDRVKEIAPIAIVKEMGRFDTGVKMGTAEWLNQRNYKGFQEKGKAFFSVRDSSYRDDLFSLGASKADEITWTWIFKACEAKIIASKKFVKNSAAYKQAVRDLFTEVITKTQVYDSPLAKSALMRSNNGLVKLTTAFMAEPTVSFNMLVAAATSGNKAKIVKAIGCFVGTTFVNALLKSLVYAARDDDEDKKYSEKYLKSLAENFTGDLNPVNLIPVVRDIVSVLSGNDVKRIDMSLFADLRSAYDIFMKEDKEPWEKAIAVIGAVGNLFGIPLKNMIRLITSSVNLTKTWKLNRNPTADSLWYSTLEGLDMALDYKKMIKEIKKGDEKEIRKLIQAMIKYKTTFGANEQDVKKAIKARLTTAFKTEYLAADTAGKNEIRRKIFATGVYEHLADLDKTLNRWKSEALKEK